MDWYYVSEGEKKGPVDVEGLKSLVRDGKLSPGDLVWNATMGETWGRVSDLPVLGPTPVVNDPKAKQAFLEKMEERRRLVAMERNKRLRFAAVMVGLVVLIASGIYAVKATKPLRQWGISSSHPLGMLDKIEARLVGENKMDKTATDISGRIRTDGLKAFVYSNPQGPRGEHVSAAGQIYILVRDDGAVAAILADFTSPGQRGYSFYDESLVSLFAWEYWGVLAKKRPRTDTGADEQSLIAFGFTDSPTKHPERVAYALPEGNAAGIWLEHGANLIYTTVYLKAK